MKAYHIDRFGSIGGIVRRSAEDPRPGPKEVLMRVRASSLHALGAAIGNLDLSRDRVRLVQEVRRATRSRES